MEEAALGVLRAECAEKAEMLAREITQREARVGELQKTAREAMQSLKTVCAECDRAVDDADRLQRDIQLALDKTNQRITSLRADSI